MIETSIRVGAAVTLLLVIIECGYWLSPAVAPALLTRTATVLGVTVVLVDLLVRRVCRRQPARAC